MGNGIKSLGQYGIPGYQEGNLVEDPEDEPGWFERMRNRHRRRAQESSGPRPLTGSPPPFLGALSIPLGARQFVGNVIGQSISDRIPGMGWLGDLIGSKDITAGSMTPAEYMAVQDAAIRAMEGKLQDASIEYEDWGTTPEGDPYADVGGGEGSGWIKKFFDPSFSMKSTFGQANIRRDPDTGDYYLTDQYNFNERDPNEEYLRAGEEPPLSTYADLQRILAEREDQGAYGFIRSFGEAFGSTPGSGSEARVNLGNLEEALARYHGDPYADVGREEEERESLFTRFMNRIRGDDEEPVSIDAPSVDPRQEIDALRRTLTPTAPVDPSQEIDALRRSLAPTEVPRFGG